MIIGTGIDLVDIPRFERTVARTPRLLHRLFAPAEQGLRVSSLAARYAAKEALIKALGGSDGVHWTEIEIASEASGRPYFALSGSTADVVAERGITTLHLSLTHDAGLAAAYVVAEARDGSGTRTSGGDRAAGESSGLAFPSPGHRSLPLSTQQRGGEDVQRGERGEPARDAAADPTMGAAS